MTIDLPDAPALLDTAWQPDPYPLYAALCMQHADTGLYFDARAGWWVTCTPDAARAALQAPALCVRPAGEPVPRALQGRPSGVVFGGLMRMNEGTVRHEAPKARARLDVAAWLSRVPGAAQTAVTCGLAPGCLGINDLLFDAPIATMALLLGCDAASVAGIAADVRALVAAWSPQAEEAARVTGDAAAQRLLARFGHDANRVGMLTQTCDATAGLLGNAIVAWQRSGGHAANAAALVQQAVRDDPVVHNTRRYAHAEVRLLGHTIKAGDTVLVLLATPRLGFGEGRHACPGEALAQAIVAELLQRWLTETPALLSSLTQRWRYRRLPNVRIPEFLTVTDERPLR